MIATAALIIGGVVLVIVLLGIAVAAYALKRIDRMELQGENIARASGLQQPFKPLLQSDRHHRRPDMWHPDRTGDNQAMKGDLRVHRGLSIPPRPAAG